MDTNKIQPAMTTPAQTVPTTKNILGHRVGDSACVVLVDSILKVGNDFVDAVAGIQKSRGEIIVRRLGSSTEISRSWVSTLSCAKSESALRKAAKSEGFKVTFFKSQAL